MFPLAIEPVGIVVAIVAVILLIAAIRFAISILFRVGIVVVLVAPRSTRRAC
ncbi:hypothetical protein [Haladaptatus sp. R4]|uniref:hypothetical protein n=1 Tax=Haladaptatus sp. R4 TaxID=1679489 RepID=UPI000AF6BAB9|nr:hypothetical protein [Haladaptatus sp. R4]